MVERVHPRGPHRAVRAAAIPVFPHSGGPLQHLIQPAGVILFQQQVIRLLPAAILAERRAEIRCAQKAGNQMPVLLFQQFQQALDRFLLPLLRGQAKAQGQNMGRLGLGGHCTIQSKKVCGKILGRLAVNPRVKLCILPVAQYLRRQRQQLGRKRIVRLAGQRRGGCAKITARFGVQRHPVAQLHLEIKQTVFGVGAHKIHPALHAGVLAAQNGIVAIHLVQHPGDHSRGIAPAGSAIWAVFHQPVGLGVGFLNIGHHIGHAAIRQLVYGKVFQPLAVKSPGIGQPTGGLAKNLCIAGPAKAFIALGAIGGHIQKVAFQPPQNVMVQLVHQRFGTGKLPRRLHGAVQHAGGKIGRFRFSRPLHHQRIAESHIGKLRLPGHRLAAGKGILHGGACFAQVGQVGVAIGVQLLKAAQFSHLPGCALHGNFHPARHVLAKIHHGAAVRCGKHPLRRDALLHAYLACGLGGQFGGRVRHDAHGVPAACGSVFRRFAFGPAGQFQRGIVCFSVVNL